MAALAVVVVFRAFIVDDAFITYRHALNCALGHGPVMNPGERVEGTSSLPWALLLALGMRAGIAPERLGPVLGILAVLATVAVAHRLSESLAGRAAARAAAWCAALTAPLAIWGASGMETAAYAALCGAWLCVLAPAQRAPGMRGGAIAGLLAAVRPEGLALALAPAVAGRWRRLRTLAGAAGGAALVFAPLVVFRVLYYGDWVPNPVHAKSPAGAAFAPGLLYAAKTGVSYALLLLFAAAGLRQGMRTVARAAGAAIALQCLFTIIVGGDHFAGARFLVPVLAPLAALAGAGVTGANWRRQRAVAVGCAAAGLALALGAERLVPSAQPLVTLARIHLPAAAHAGRIADEVRHVGIVLLGAALWAEFGARAAARGPRAALVLALTAALGPQAWDPQIRACRHADGASVYGRAVGAWLAKALPAQAVVATNAAGALPYVSRLPVIDMLGLTDRAIARSRPDPRQWVGHERGDGALVLRRRPDLIVLGGAEGSLTPWPFPGDQQLFAAPEFHAAYVPMRAAVAGPAGPFDFLFYSRADRCELLRQAGAVDAARPGP